MYWRRCLAGRHCFPCLSCLQSPQNLNFFPEAERRSFYPEWLSLTSCLFSSDASPASSSSGTLIQYTPDSATSPTADHPSQHPTYQKVKDKGDSGARKGKSRTAFSQEQLQTLHQRFQSQKYLSPHQIRELAAVLGLTYKQVTSSSEKLSCIFKCKVALNIFLSFIGLREECFSLYFLRSCPAD